MTEEPYEHLDPWLATAIAGQVSAGLTPGDGQQERCYGALVAIGLMVYNACPDDIVREVLEAHEWSVVERSPEGGWQTTYRPPKRLGVD